MNLCICVHAVPSSWALCVKMTHTGKGRSAVTGCASIVNPFGETIALDLGLILVQEVS